MGSFEEIINLEPMANLTYQNDIFAGFILVDYSTESDKIDEIHRNIREFPSLADSFPPTVDHRIAFCTRSMSLSDMLKKPDFVSNSLREGGRVEDYLRNMTGNLGLIFVTCLEQNIPVDCSPEKIFMIAHQDSYPRIRAITVKGDVPNFVTWKTQLLSLYKKIWDVIYPEQNPDPNASKSCSVIPPKRDVEFDKFFKKLEQTLSLKDVKAVFNCWIFWSKFTRTNVILKFGPLTKMCSSRFQFVNRTTLLPKWRSIMERDEKMESLMTDIQKNTYDKNLSMYAYLEVDLLLKFLRRLITHFNLFCATTFTTDLALIKHLEDKFPESMCEIYAGCEKLDDMYHQKKPLGFNFNLKKR